MTENVIKDKKERNHSFRMWLQLMLNLIPFYNSIISKNHTSGSGQRELQLIVIPMLVLRESVAPDLWSLPTRLTSMTLSHNVSLNSGHLNLILVKI